MKSQILNQSTAKRYRSKMGNIYIIISVKQISNQDKNILDFKNFEDKPFFPHLYNRNENFSTLASYNFK
jgi:hypothetical protein